MRKRILNPDVGSNLDALATAGEIDGLVHSDGVVVDCPGYKRVYLSGIVAIDEDDDVIAPGDVETQTRAILNEIKSYLEDVGGGINDVVRVRVYVDGYDESDLLTIHEVRAEFFDKEHYPASTLVEVERLAIEGLRIEFDADAIVPEDGWEVSEP